MLIIRLQSPHHRSSEWPLGSGHLGVVQCLVNAGADKDKADYSGATPLLAAVQDGHLGVVQYLVEAGAVKENVLNNGASSLFVAAENGRNAVVQYLLQQGTDANKTDKYGRLPIDVSANETIKQLIRDKLNHIIDIDGNTNKDEIITS